MSRAITPDHFTTFGDLLKHLRRRAGLTQRELSVAVGYSESQISRLEQNQRAPDPATLAARFVPALQLEYQPAWVARLLDLARAAGPAPAAGDEAALPAPPSAPPPPNNLPRQLTSFIGRARELDQVCRHLAPPSGDGATAAVCLTLIGPGGTGKSRLAVQAASGLLSAFPDGLWLVELAALADPALVPGTVAAALGLREERARLPLQVLTDFLQARQALLILDNCEHLADAAAQLAEALLRACPRLQLLVSSREALGLPGEIVLRVPPLSRPDPRQGLPAEDLLGYEAVQLFVERAAAVLPGFAVTAENAPAVAQVCYRLDGIPLALELAAARVPVLTVEQIAARLDDRFRLLTGGSRTALPRQQTLRALIDWSYDLLSPAERLLFQRLAVFSGSFTLEAAEAVCPDPAPSATSSGAGVHGRGVQSSPRSEAKWVNAPTPSSAADLPSSVVRPPSSLHPHPSSFILHPSEVLDLLAQLVNKSLVVAEPAPAEEARYHLLETIRQYARDKLLEAGDGAPVRDRHLAYYLRLAEQAEPELRRSQQWLWGRRLAAEFDNFRAAMEWALEGQAQAGLRLACALEWFYPMYDRVEEGAQRALQLLARPEVAAPTPLRAAGLFMAGRFILWQGDLAGSRPLYEEGLRLSRQLGDPAGEALGLHIAGMAALLANDYERGRDLMSASLALYRRLDDPLGLADLLVNWKGVSGTLDYAQSRAYLEEARQLYARQGDHLSVAYALEDLCTVAVRLGDFALARAFLDERAAFGRSRRWDSPFSPMRQLGELALYEGRYAEARTYLQDALRASRLGQYRSGAAWDLAKLAYVDLRDGDDPQARAKFAECLAFFQSAGMPIGVVYAVEGLASLAVRWGDLARAARLFHWADLTRALVHDPRPPVEQAEVDADWRLIRAGLDEAAQAQAAAEGRALTLEQAAALAGA